MWQRSLWVSAPYVAALPMAQCPLWVSALYGSALPIGQHSVGQRPVWAEQPGRPAVLDPRRLPGGSALCSYGRAALRAAFEGRFLEREKDSAQWSARSAPGGPRPGTVSPWGP